MISNGFEARRRRAKKRQKDAVYAQACLEVDRRDHSLCRICAGPGAHHHHVVYRSHLGQHATHNLITVCVPCHEAIHRKLITVSGNADERISVTRRLTVPDVMR